MIKVAIQPTTRERQEIVNLPMIDALLAICILKVVALSFRTILSLQRRKRVACLHALGDDLQMETASQIDHRTNNHLTADGASADRNMS